MLSSTQPVHRTISWIGALCLLLLALSLSACGGGGDATASNTSSSPAQTNASSSGSSSSSAPANAVTVTIAEKTGGHDIYSFDPQTVTIKAGTTVKWVNNSDENHLFSSTPTGVFTASSMVPRSGSDTNTYQVTFSTPGTYSYTSTLVHRMNNQPEGMSSSATGTITVTP